MKVTNIRRKLIAALVAGGMLAPSALQAADLNTNVIVNGGFENVDLGVTSSYGSVKILDWDDGTRTGFAYAHGQPNDFANGGPLATGGQFYFAPASTPGWPNVPREVSQIIDVSDGATGALIPSGVIGWKLQADFSGYLTQPDSSQVDVEFLDAAGAHIGVASINNTGFTSTWNQRMGSGGVPSGTKTIQVSLVRRDPQQGGPDGYIDNVDFQFTASVPQLAILVDRETGNITMHNLTGSFENISGYSITSSFGALKPAEWLSIADNYDSGSPGAEQVDSANAWREFTSAAVRTDLSEGDLSSGLGANLANSRQIDLGDAWIQTPIEDLVFQYVSDGQVINGVVGFIGNGNSKLPLGDLTADGEVNSADWTFFKAGQHSDMTGLSLAEAYKKGDLNRDSQNNHADFVLFKERFELINGSGSFDLMLASIPEPSTAVLILAAGLMMLPGTRRLREEK